MTCNASKFRSPSYRTKLALSGALSSCFPTFEGIRLQRLTPCPIRRGDKIRVRRGALVQFKGVVAPYFGSATVKATLLYPGDKELLAHTNSLRPCAFGPNLGEVILHLGGFEHFLQRCGIALLEGQKTLIRAASPELKTLSEWLTKDQIRTLVLAGRIRYEREDLGQERGGHEVRVYLVSPATICWAGEKGYWREASAEDCTKAA